MHNIDIWYIINYLTSFLSSRDKTIKWKQPGCWRRDILNRNGKLGLFDSMFDFDDQEILKKLEPCPHILDTTFLNLKAKIGFCACFKGKNSILLHHNIPFIPFLQVLRFFIDFSINITVFYHFWACYWCLFSFSLFFIPLYISFPKNYLTEYIIDQRPA